MIRSNKCEPIIFLSTFFIYKKNILINQELTINKIQPTKHTFDKIQNPVYNKFSYSHEENSFLDYEREGLMAIQVKNDSKRI